MRVDVSVFVLWVEVFASVWVLVLIIEVCSCYIKCFSRMVNKGIEGFSVACGVCFFGSVQEIYL